ncbi:hypothetical protein GGR88_002522 [Sphingomonas jejuensis]|uniref:Uncharacterized protein n=1 Tax=Sphingomonas jejuensis TaxID=904715 RepID=A0ABX0XNP7_9SPHN|nr:hypothetical protein [Sphingomonas jejuensis]NJC35008.1 hypothetical protein [Sphingomonas jejuensis]
MMKMLLGSALLAYAAPGVAQVQARYSEDHGRRIVLWEVAANGDYRVGDADGQRHRLTIGRQTWEVAFADGRWHVATIETIAEARERTTSAFLRGVARYLSNVAARQGDNLYSQGRVTVAGFPGTRYLYATDAELSQPEDEHGAGIGPIAFDDRRVVISDDARLLALGEAMRRHSADDLALSGGLIDNPARNQLHHSLDWLASHGTVLENDSAGFRLVIATFEAPAPERLRLPNVAPHDVEALVRLIRARQDPFAPR